MAITTKLFATAAIAAILVGTAPAGAQTKADPSLVSIATLRAAAEKVRTFRPKDQFDSPPDMSALVGRRFEVETAPRATGPANQICPGTPMYSYDHPTLSIMYNNQVLLGNFDIDVDTSDGNGLGFFNTYAFDCAVSAGRSYVGSNAFGASAVVSVQNDRFLAFASARALPSQEDTWEQTATPSVARDLARSVRVRVRGTVGKWTNGQPVECGTYVDEAKIDYPYEERQSGCFFKADIDSVDAIDSRTGNTLHVPGAANGVAPAAATTDETSKATTPKRRKPG
jgi:hypothetical protein